MQSSTCKFFLFSCVVLSLFSCSNEVDVVGEWQEIPIVYGVLRHQDPVQYIRIEKAFLDPEVSALEVARNPDSLYFAEDEIDVILLQRDVVTNADIPFNLVDTLSRVDLTLLGIVKEPGIFATSPNYAYITDIPLLQGREYRLEIQSKKTRKVYIAYTKVIPDFENFGGGNFFITVPSTTSFVNWSFVNPITGQDEYTDRVSFRWTAPQFARLYELGIIFHYAEFEVDESVGGEPELAGTRVEKSILWRPVQNFIPSNNITQVALSGESFYNFLRRELRPVTGTNTRRCAIDLEIVVEAAGEFMANYIQARQANEGLIGGLNPAAPYSNIEGGFGLFASTNKTVKPNIRIGASSIEFISRNELTSDLGFRLIGCPR